MVIVIQSKCNITIFKNKRGINMKKLIREIAELIPGVNQSRVDKLGNDENSCFYDQRMFEADLNEMYKNVHLITNSFEEPSYVLNAGDIVISNSMQLATIVGSSVKQRILTLNFVKVKLDNDIDKAYFVYLFNLNKEIQKQKEKETQSMGLVQRITLRSLETIEIPILKKEQCERIGNVYVEMLRNQDNLNRYVDLIGMLTYSMLEQSLGGKNNE